MLLCAVGILGLSLVMMCNAIVFVGTRDRLLPYGSEVDEKFDAIIVLGCKVMPDGTPSAMLQKRVECGVRLLNEGVSDVLLLSGDSQYDWYSETDCMKNTAISLGADESAILTDGLGLSTVESLERAKDQFGFSNVIVVTQGFHCYRSAYFADMVGIDAVCMAAADTYYSDATLFKNNFREILARGGAVITRLFHDIFGA